MTTIMKKVAFHTLGCKLNFSETSMISRMFTQRGFHKVDLQDGPDIFVINTCSVTEKADKKCAKIVNDVLKVVPNAFIIIIGCYAQLKPHTIAQIPGVDAVLGTNEKFKLLALLTHFEKSTRPAVHVKPIQTAKTFAPAYSIGDRTRTFLKVQDGCNYHCSFCTIPLARGKSRSATIASIVQQTHEIAQKGIKEVVLTGVNIGDYGIRDNRRQTSFLALLQALDQITDIKRFRISSIEPNLLTNEIITFVAQSARFVPHFHVPLQSGNDKVLQLMRRRYPRQLYADRVATIKQYMPTCCIGVDVIVGFPGETQEDFLATYRFLRDLPIAYLHVFPYSERSHTHAVNLSGVVPQAVRMERAETLRILSEKKLRDFYESNLHSVATVLFEQGVTADNLIAGFTENYVRVTVPYKAHLPNSLRTVYLRNVHPTGLVMGELAA